QSFTTKVVYTGKFFQADGKDRDDFAGFGGLVVSHKSRAKGTIYNSLNWPSKARRWLPLRDHPADGAMVTMRATFPERLTVHSNGHLVSKGDPKGGARTWHYEALTPMPPYDIFVAAFDGWDDVAHAAKKAPVEVHAITYAHDTDAAARAF